MQILNLIASAKSFLLQKVTYSQVPGVRMWTSLGEPLSCLPQGPEIEPQSWFTGFKGTEAEECAKEPEKLDRTRRPQPGGWLGIGGDGREFREEEMTASIKRTRF